ncbi:MAG: DMT family transporter [Cyclobacteriaceae bacterium]|jgi:drug/metabolite transporter (DMT)-like permease|nr:DMT family transporter [Cyclobacteriaceae bacterium]
MITAGDYFKLHFVVFLWGFTAILGKLITLPPVEMILFRTVLATIGLAAVMLFRKSDFRVAGKDVPGLFLTGAIIAAHWIAFFGSARMANVSISLAGFATASLWTAIIEPLARGRRIKGFEVFLGLCVIAGIVIIFSFDDGYRAGFLVAILSGLLAAIFAVINARYTERIAVGAITLYEMAGAAFSIAVFLPFYRWYWVDDGMLRLVPTAHDWIYLLILSGVCTVYAFVVMLRLMRKIPVFFIQLTINLEPVYGILMALIVFGESERMDARFYVGTFIIISSIIAYPFLRRRYGGSIPSQR